MNRLDSLYGCDVPGCATYPALVLTVNFSNDSTTFRTGFIEKYGAKSVCVPREEGGSTFNSILANDYYGGPQYLIAPDKSITKYGNLESTGIVPHVHSSGATTFPMTLTAETGGTIKASPSAPLYDSGFVVTLTATAAKGYEFAGWGGDTTGMTNPIQVTMTRARTISAQFTPLPVDTTHLVINQDSIVIDSVSSEELSSENGAAANLLDGSASTIWHTQYSPSVDVYPHEVIFKLSRLYGVSGFEYTPRQSGANGRIADYEIYVSRDGINWGTSVNSGTWASGTAVQTVTFPAVGGEYVKFAALSEQSGQSFASAAEINILHDGRWKDFVGVSTYKHVTSEPFLLTGTQLALGSSIQHGVLRISGFNGRLIMERSVSAGQIIDLATMKLSSGAYLVQVNGKNYSSPAMRCMIR